MRKAEIKFNREPVGLLIENENGYCFIYDSDYLKLKNRQHVSLSFPF